MNELNDIQKDKLIEQFLNNELKGNTLLFFKKLIKEDEKLAREIEFRKELIFTLKYQKLIQFNRKVESIIESNTVIPDLSFKLYDIWNIKWLKWSIWFTLPLLFFLIWNINQNTIQKKAINDFLNLHIQHQNVAIGISDSDSSLFAEGLRQYNEFKYSEAIFSLNQSFKKREITYGRLYLGLAHLYLDNEDKAVIEFKKMIEVNNGIFNEDAKWFMALAYLKKQKLYEAKIIFQELKQSANYSENSKNILEILE